MNYSYIKIGPFVTQAHKNGRLFTSSRALRKEHKILITKATLTWLMSLLFMIGAFCFVLASALSLVNYHSSFSINTIYFVGSLFFTLAAYTQFLEVINADITNESHITSSKRKWIWLAYRPNNLGYLSSFTQLIGTIFFNINTFESYNTELSTLASDIIIWIPNLLGSILFLIASFFAWLEIYKDNHIKAFRSSSWWIVWLNNFGSIFFQVSAFASFIYLDSRVVNGTAALEYTLLGGICFFVGAFLLIIEMREHKTL